MNKNHHDEESECDERSPNDSPNMTKKSLSTVGFRNNIENQNSRQLSLRATQSLTGDVEELRLASNFQRMNLCNRMTISTPKVPTSCPCGCFLRPATIGSFRTREKDTLALYIVTPDILNHHGHNFESNEIAMFWKKDCRMFLWKGKAKSKNVINADFYKNTI